MSNDSSVLPLAALVGLDTARRALLLLAVNPRLGGCVLGAGVGTGKSTLARGFAALLGGESPFVELPVGVSEDRLLGGLDIEATLAQGRRIHRSGLLAQAHLGVLNIDGLNLLESSLSNHLLAALDSGEVRIEREGLSVREPARFVLLSTYDPSDGPPRRHLLDRVGLIVAPISASSAADRYEVVRRNRAWLRASEEQRQTWEDEEALMIGIVGYARELLPTVRISDEQVERLVGTALALGVEGHRADVFSVQCALASAALAHRDEVIDEDLEEAVRFVLLPRATRMPAPPPEPQQDETPPPQTPEPPEQRDEQQDEDTEKPPEPEEPRAIEELIFDALETEIAPDVLETPFSVQRHGRGGSRGSSDDARRGRHIRSIPGSPRQGRLDIIATLRAAAPWQRLRDDGAPPAAPDAPRRVRLRADDLHIKRYRNKAGTLFCFAVDASGSMALHRMRQAKGAVGCLLQQAYIHRDQVALLAFRGDSAEVLLPPSQSVELARRALDTLPTGGGTPLASALLAAYQLAAQARSRGINQVMLVLITDGRPNVPLQPEPGESKDAMLQRARDEVQRLATSLRTSGIGAVVIDTQRSFLSRGEASQLAAWLGGRYIYLPQARAEQIASAVRGAADEA